MPEEKKGELDKIEISDEQLRRLSLLRQNQRDEEDHEFAQFSVCTSFIKREKMGERIAY